MFKVGDEVVWNNCIGIVTRRGYEDGAKNKYTVTFNYMNTETCFHEEFNSCGDHHRFDMSNRLKKIKINYKTIYLNFEEDKTKCFTCNKQADNDVNERTIGRKCILIETYNGESLKDEADFLGLYRGNS